MIETPIEIKEVEEVQPSTPAESQSSAPTPSSPAENAAASSTPTPDQSANPTQPEGSTAAPTPDTTPPQPGVQPEQTTASKVEQPTMAPEEETAQKEDLYQQLLAKGLLTPSMHDAAVSETSLDSLKQMLQDAEGGPSTPENPAAAKSVDAVVEDQKRLWFGDDEGKEGGVLHHYLKMKETTDPQFVEAKQKLVAEVEKEHHDRAAAQFKTENPPGVDEETYVANALKSWEELREVEIETRWKTVFAQEVQKRVAEMKKKGVEAVFAELADEEGEETEAEETPTENATGETPPTEGATAKKEKKTLKKWLKDMRDTAVAGGLSYVDSCIKGSSFEAFIDAFMSSGGFQSLRSGGGYFTERGLNPEKMLGYDAFREQCLEEESEEKQKGFGVGLSVLLNKAHEAAQKMGLKLDLPTTEIDWEDETAAQDKLQPKIRAFYELCVELIEQNQEKKLADLLSRDEAWGDFFEHDTALSDDLLIFFKLTGKNNEEFKRVFGGEQKQA